MHKIFKPMLAATLAAVIAAGSTLPAFAYDKETVTSKADMLKTLELFQGTENGYELEKPLTRMEAVIMLIRLLGKETEALYGDEYAHPFTDAPEWDGASRYLGYAYEKGLTVGVTPTTFDPESRADIRMYATFALRALGFDGNGVSAWDNWEQFSQDSALIPESVDHENFLRGDAVEMSIATLNAKISGSEMTLKEKFTEEGLFHPLALAVAEVIGGKQVTSDSPLMDILGAMYANTNNFYPSRMMAMEIPEDNMSFYLGVTAEELPYEEAIFCEPMMTSMPHSVCLVRVKDGVDIEAAKKAIAEKVDPAKWICVSVDPGNIYVESIGNLIMLVMDNLEPEALVNAFRAMDPAVIRPDENGMMKVEDTYVEADEAVNISSLENLMFKLIDIRDNNFPNTDKVYLATIPEKSFAARESVLHYLNHKAISSSLKEMLFDWTHIELSDTLSLDNYYSTDRHWKQEDLLPTVKKLGETMGFTVSEDKFEKHIVENFVGDYKKKVPGIPAETLTYMTSEFTESAVVDNFQDPTVTSVYDTAKLSSKTPYDVFLSGATPLTVITNPKATDKRELVIFRDSFGSSIAPLMLESYSKITLVDLRYMASDLLPEHVDFTDAEVLVLLSDKVVNNSAMLK